MCQARSGSWLLRRRVRSSYFIVNVECQARLDFCKVPSKIGILWGAKQDWNFVRCQARLGFWLFMLVLQGFFMTTNSCYGNMPDEWDDMHDLVLEWCNIIDAWWCFIQWLECFNKFQYGGKWPIKIKKYFFNKASCQKVLGCCASMISRNLSWTWSLMYGRFAWIT